MKVKAEFIDNQQEFKWRLVKGNKVSKWTSQYEGILTHEFDGELYGLATDYWREVLPTEIPFLITPIK